MGPKGIHQRQRVGEIRRGDGTTSSLGCRSRRLGRGKRDRTQGYKATLLDPSPLTCPQPLLSRQIYYETSIHLSKPGHGPTSPLSRALDAWEFFKRTDDTRQEYRTKNRSDLTIPPSGKKCRETNPDH